MRLNLTTLNQPFNENLNKPFITNNLIYINSNLFTESFKDSFRNTKTINYNEPNRALVNNAKSLCHQSILSSELKTISTDVKRNSGSFLKNNFYNNSGEKSVKSNLDLNSSLNDLDSFNKKRFELETIL